MKFKDFEQKEKFKDLYKSFLADDWICYCSAFCKFADVCDKSFDKSLDFNSTVGDEECVKDQ